jgi:hypothetical protein
MGQPNIAERLKDISRQLAEIASMLNSGHQANPPTEPPPPHQPHVADRLEQVQRISEYWESRGFNTDPAAGRLSLPWGEMNPGEWFAVPIRSVSTSNSVRTYASQQNILGKVFSVKKAENFLIVTRES